ncbi:transcription elongation factor A protein 3 isoform X7 [Silurus meridionalis]|uniref:transcription elongation factor A protein 3 isoform X7 n=1 Tax=Silurus meridionalis TaxID=175797 RepID=UPI001EEB3B60|nr:transcription elongation factor A protein 3 isoform X7 [Silurus meridionalis]
MNKCGTTGKNWTKYFACKYFLTFGNFVQEGALDLLRELQKFDMTLKLLQDTRIGMSVNGIRKHCSDEDVVSLAKILIKNWKRLLESSHSQKAERPNEIKNGSTANTQSPSGPSPDAESSPKSSLNSPKKPVDKHRKVKNDAVFKKERHVSDHKKEKADSNHTKERERMNVMDSSVSSSASPLHHHKCSSLEVKKDRKQPVNPDASLPALPLHLHPSTLTKRPPLDMQKEKEKEAKDKERKDMPAPKRSAQQLISEHQKHSRDLGESKPAKRLSTDMKKERMDSSSFSQQPLKKPINDTKKERKDSTDSKSIQRQQSSDSKPQRRDSVNPKSGSSPLPKKLSEERREAHVPKLTLPGAIQRKVSTDSNDERKSKPETPKTPSTPTTPLSPSFSPAGGPLSPHLLTGDSVRDKCIEMLSAALRTDDDYKYYGANCDAMAAEIEDHIYQEIKAKDMKYKNRVRSRISNLKDPKNPNLRKNVLGGAIELSRIASMSAEEMASDELKQLRNILTQEAIREHQMAKTSGTTTDLLQCGKCKKKNCTYNQVQTRSADEPMTTFVLCNECGNRWKFC